MNSSVEYEKEDEFPLDPNMESIYNKVKEQHGTPTSFDFIYPMIEAMEEYNLHKEVNQPGAFISMALIDKAITEKQADIQTYLDEYNTVRESKNTSTIERLESEYATSWNNFRFSLLSFGLGSKYAKRWFLTRLADTLFKEGHLETSFSLLTNGYASTSLEKNIQKHVFDFIHYYDSRRLFDDSGFGLGLKNQAATLSMFERVTTNNVPIHDEYLIELLFSEHGKDFFSLPLLTTDKPMAISTKENAIIISTLFNNNYPKLTELFLNKFSEEVFIQKINDKWENAFNICIKASADEYSSIDFIEQKEKLQDKIIIQKKLTTALAILQFTTESPIFSHIQPQLNVDGINSKTKMKYTEEIQQLNHSLFKESLMISNSPSILTKIRKIFIRTNAMLTTTDIKSNSIHFSESPKGNNFNNTHSSDTSTPALLHIKSPLPFFEPGTTDKIVVHLYMKDILEHARNTDNYYVVSKGHKKSYEKLINTFFDESTDRVAASPEIVHSNPVISTIVTKPIVEQSDSQLKNKLPIEAETLLKDIHSLHQQIQENYSYLTEIEKNDVTRIHSNQLKNISDKYLAIAPIYRERKGVQQKTATELMLDSLLNIKETFSHIVDNFVGLQISELSVTQRHTKEIKESYVNNSSILQNDGIVQLMNVKPTDEIKDNLNTVNHITTEINVEQQQENVTVISKNDIKNTTIHKKIRI